jgi:hypothetical protein
VGYILRRGAFILSRGTFASEERRILERRVHLAYGRFPYHGGDSFTIARRTLESRGCKGEGGCILVEFC